jgi:hypothetical protein
VYPVTYGKVKAAVENSCILVPVYLPGQRGLRVRSASKASYGVIGIILTPEDAGHTLLSHLSLALSLVSRHRPPPAATTRYTPHAT